MDPFLLLVVVVLVALAFDVTNGFHDTANSVAPMLAARSVGPRAAVTIVALSNGAGALAASGAVAATIGTGIIDPAAITLPLVLSALCGAIVWNVATWRFAIPCSSSLALVGGLAGAGIASGGIGAVSWSTVADKAFVPALLAPLVGASIAAAIWMLIVRTLGKRRRRPVERNLRRLQVASAAMQSFAHGTNDAQKTMGVIALALLAGSPTETFSVPLWVVLACSASLTIGTLAGGWRIIAMMSRGIARMDLAQGLAATTAGGIVLLLASRFGMPVSTTYASVGSIIGAGATKGLHRVRWQAGQEILIAWAITIPCTAAVALLCSVIAGVAPLLLAAGVLVLLTWMLRENAKDGGGGSRESSPAAMPAPAAV